MAGTAALLSTGVLNRGARAQEATPTPTHHMGGMPGGEMIMPGIVGTVDHAANGFDPTELLYDFDPGVNTDEADLGRINPTPVPGPGTAQDSWNNGMGFLGVTAGSVTRPVIPGAFDP